jgi:hypothetical protein
MNVDYREETVEREDSRLRKIREIRESLIPVMAELRSAGYSEETVDELRRSGKKYESAISILLKWLPRLPSPAAKVALVRALSVPWAKPAAGPILITEFERTPPEQEELRWTLGNALEVVAEPSLLNKFVEIVMDKANGTAREMIVLALAKIRDPRSVTTLIKLLDDQQVAGHAVRALRRLKAPQALDHLEKFTTHSESWIRNEARKAIADIMKAHPPNLRLLK